MQFGSHPKPYPQVFAEGKIRNNRQSVTMWEPVEWHLQNLDWSGNPFDLAATVTFQHQDGRTSHTTKMFYHGENTWGFRFTGTKSGDWTYTTASSDSDLDGLKGKLTVRFNPNRRIRGFLTQVENKFAIQTKDAETLQGYLFNVYMNEEDFPPYLVHWKNSQNTCAYLSEARLNGSEIIFFHVNNSWLQLGAQGYHEHNSHNPDLRSFEILEALISNTHRMGGRVHLWAWGDDAEHRKWTPSGLDGGINGKVDQRIQQYISARLGPLPGWTMSYGFDLQEWVSEEETLMWAKFVRENLGWPHLLWARGRFNPELDALSYSNLGPFDYDHTAQLLKKTPQRPHLYEERFTYQRDGIFSMDVTRRLHWQYAMAGGIGSFWGFFPKQYGKVAPRYPQPEQLRTHYHFWHLGSRFKLDMSIANNLTDGYALKTADNQTLILYREDASTISADLSNMSGPQFGVAINTKKEYKEISLGLLEPKQQVIRLPEKSDWAIAIGSIN